MAGTMALGDLRERLLTFQRLTLITNKKPLMFSEMPPNSLPGSSFSLLPLSQSILEVSTFVVVEYQSSFPIVFAHSVCP